MTESQRMRRISQKFNQEYDLIEQLEAVCAAHNLRMEIYEDQEFNQLLNRGALEYCGETNRYYLDRDERIEPPQPYSVVRIYEAGKDKPMLQTPKYRHTLKALTVALQSLRSHIKWQARLERMRKRMGIRPEYLSHV